MAPRSPASIQDIERQHWTAEEFAEVEAAYEAEVRRGADPQWWEDVSVGDELPAVIKGRLTVVDIISMHMGWGWGGYGVGPLKFAHQLRKRMPAFYTPDEYGVPDVVQRLHWDPRRAQALGIPAPYDYGQMRAAWVSHLLTNWIGDDGWLAEMDLQMRGFNYHGDIHRCTGRSRRRRQSRRGGVARGRRHQPTRRGHHAGAPPKSCSRPRTPARSSSRFPTRTSEGAGHRSLRGLRAGLVMNYDRFTESDAT